MHAIRRSLSLPSWGPAWNPPTSGIEHGFLVTSYAVGKTVGLARNADVVTVPIRANLSPEWLYRETIIAGLVSIANDLDGKPKDSAIVNLSFGQEREAAPLQSIWTVMSESRLTTSPCSSFPGKNKKEKKRRREKDGH